jgi:hypothetical protein
MEVRFSFVPMTVIDKPTARMHAWRGGGASLLRELGIARTHARGEVMPGLPALVAYCVHGAPIKRRKAATRQGEIERVTFCRQPIASGQSCKAAGPTFVIAADRIAADPAPTIS